MTAMARLGKYELLETIGRGGYGTVYRARDTVLDVERALKELHPGLAADPEFIERFRREARLAARLEHPHIVPVYDLDQAEGRYFLVMRYMAGGSLKDHLERQGRLTFEQALAITSQIASALDFAHQRNLVHRDVKPGNILFEANEGTDQLVARLSDFGFARAIQGTSSASFSFSGGIMGTPAYMAPEAWERTEPHPAMDVYSLACVFYEMIHGKSLFAGQSPMEIIRRQALEEPSLLELWPDDAPPGMDGVVRRALARNPAQRYASVEFAATLQRLEQAEVERREAEERAQRAAEESARRQAEEQARREAEERVRQIAIAQAAQEAEARVRREMGEKARQEAEERGRQKAMVDAARQAEARARRETAEEIVAKEAEEKRPVPILERVGKTRLLSWKMWLGTGVGVVLLVALGWIGFHFGFAEPYQAETLTLAPTTTPTATIALLPSKPTEMLAFTPSPTAISTDTVEPIPTETVRKTLTPEATFSPTPRPPTQTSTPITALVNLTALQLRAGPNTYHPMLASYPRGTQVTILWREPTGEWLYVVAPDGMEGWMQSEYLDLRVEIDQIQRIDVTPTLPPTRPPTNTPRPPTNTPRPPTDTPPPPTNTPLPPTDTPSPPPPPPTSTPSTSTPPMYKQQLIHRTRPCGDVHDRS